jgi:hypothetical protein
MSEAKSGAEEQYLTSFPHFVSLMRATGCSLRWARIDHPGEGGTLHIKYSDLDQLDLVLRKLNGELIILPSPLEGEGG